MKHIKLFETFNPLNENKKKYKRVTPKSPRLPKGSIVFTSPDVIDAVAALSDEERKKLRHDIEKANKEGSTFELRMDGKKVKFKRV